MQEDVATCGAPSAAGADLPIGTAEAPARKPRKRKSRNRRNRRGRGKGKMEQNTVKAEDAVGPDAPVLGTVARVASAPAALQARRTRGILRTQIETASRAFSAPLCPDPLVANDPWKGVQRLVALDPPAVSPAPPTKRAQRSGNEDGHPGPAVVKARTLSLVEFLEGDDPVEFPTSVGHVDQG